jgi:hypothetical protein
MAGPTRRTKTSFAAGELAPELYGRGDLRAFENGARRLRNVVIQPTGGVARRPGAAPPGGPARPRPADRLRVQHRADLPAGADRGRLQVFLEDAEVASLAAPWTAATLPQMAFTQKPTRCCCSTRTWRRGASPAAAT